MTPQDQVAAYSLPARGPLFRLARRGWYPAALSLGILLASIPGYLSPPGISVFEGVLVFERTPLIATLEDLIYLAPFLAAALTLRFAALLFVKKSGDCMGLLLAYYLLAHGVSFAGPIELLQPLWPKAPWINSLILQPLYAGPATMALVGLFPDGHFVPRWAPWLIPVGAIGAALAIWGQNLALMPLAVEHYWVWVLLAAICWVAFVPSAIYAQLYRCRRVSTPAQRQQTKWVQYGLALWFMCIVASSPGWLFALSLPPGTVAPWWLHAGTLGWTLSAFCLPVSLTIAVLRYRLFDIDLLINRTLVYGALTACVVALYVLVVGGLGVLLHDSRNLLVSLAATGLVAIVVQALCERLRRAVNCLVYGERDEPMQVLARLGRQLEENVSPDSLLAGMAETVRSALKLPYVAIDVVRGEWCSAWRPPAKRRKRCCNCRWGTTARPSGGWRWPRATPASAARLIQELKV
jgi:hypothetical protein